MLFTEGSISGLKEIDEIDITIAAKNERTVNGFDRRARIMSSRSVFVLLANLIKIFSASVRANLKIIPQIIKRARAKAY
jgi:hypothetical protein